MLVVAMWVRHVWAICLAQGTVWVNFKVFNFILVLSAFHTLVQCGRQPNYYFNYYFARQGRQKIFIFSWDTRTEVREKRKSCQMATRAPVLGKLCKEGTRPPFEIRSVSNSLSEWVVKGRCERWTWRWYSDVERHCIDILHNLEENCPSSRFQNLMLPPGPRHQILDCLFISV